VDRIHHRQAGVHIIAAEYFDLLRERPDALGPKPDLCGRLFAGDIERLALRPKMSAGLEQQRTLTDPRFAADEDRRAAHKTTPEHTIQFGEPRGDASP